MCSISFFHVQLHTLEDFPAHSNFCELALIKMGYHDIFVHVGDQVKVQGRDGQWVAPLVTGMFNSSLFPHYVLMQSFRYLWIKRLHS